MIADCGLRIQDVVVEQSRDRVRERSAVDVRHGHSVGGSDHAVCREEHGRGGVRRPQRGDIDCRRIAVRRRCRGRRDIDCARAGDVDERITDGITGIRRRERRIVSIVRRIVEDETTGDDDADTRIRRVRRDDTERACRRLGDAQLRSDEQEHDRAEHKTQHDGSVVWWVWCGVVWCGGVVCGVLAVGGAAVRS